MEIHEDCGTTAWDICLSLMESGLLAKPTHVSRHAIAGIWVAFFSRCQRYRCGQGGYDGGFDGGFDGGWD